MQRGGVYIDTWQDKGKKFTSFFCENGHHTFKRNDAFAQTWCMECHKVDITSAHTLAETRGGYFLSTKMEGVGAKYQWQCQFGHKWMAQYNNVYTGKWCPKCARISLKWFQDFAISKGGQCLSDTVSSEGPVTYRCAMGHIWTTRGLCSRRGCWCAKCSNNLQENACRFILESAFGKSFPSSRPKWLRYDRYPLELDGYCEDLGLAFEYQGKQHYEQIQYWQKTSQAFIDLQKRDAFKVRRCDERAISLLVVPYNEAGTVEQMFHYIAGTCPKFPIGSPVIREVAQPVMHQKLLEMQHLLQRWPGSKLLSTSYAGVACKYRFACTHHHEVEMRKGELTFYFKRPGNLSFCVICNRDEITREVSRWCVNKRLKLLNDYINNREEYEWECLRCSTILKGSLRLLKTAKKYAVFKSPANTTFF